MAHCSTQCLYYKLVRDREAGKMERLSGTSSATAVTPMREGCDFRGASHCPEGSERCDFYSKYVCS